MIFGSNIKLLRNRRGKTQDDLARILSMKRPTYSGYENNIAQPNIPALITFSEYYKISIDTLVKIDLTKLSESQLSEIERGFDVYVTGSRIRVLATTVNPKNKENIELVTEKAKAGYTRGFADPEFIKDLPVFNLPFLSEERKYRAFQLNGDSMNPIPDKAWVTAEFLQDWRQIENHRAYIIVTLNDGVVFKIAENFLETEGKLKLHSLNPMYEPFEVDVKDISEVWKFALKNDMDKIKGMMKGNFE